MKPAVFPWLEFHLQLGLFMARFSHLSAALTLHIALRFPPVCLLLIRLVRHARAAHSASFLPSCLSPSGTAMRYIPLSCFSCTVTRRICLAELKCVNRNFILVLEFIFGLAWNLIVGRERRACTSNLNDKIYHAPHFSSLPL